MTYFMATCPCCDLIQGDPEAIACEECGAKLYPSEEVLDTVRGERSKYWLYDHLKRPPRRNLGVRWHE